MDYSQVQVCPRRGRQEKREVKEHPWSRVLGSGEAGGGGGGRRAKPLGGPGDAQHHERALPLNQHVSSGVSTFHILKPIL